jgi:Protein of unknown function (DUF4254)
MVPVFKPSTPTFWTVKLPNDMRLSGCYLFTCFAKCSDVLPLSDVADESEKCVFETIRELYLSNAELWRLEDMAHQADLPPLEVAWIKRRIDQFNLQRSEARNATDEIIVRTLCVPSTCSNFRYPLLTETPADLLDRLSIISLKLFHCEQASSSHVEKSPPIRLVTTVLREQAEFLCSSFDYLIDGLRQHEWRFYRVHQFKLYNGSFVKSADMNRKTHDPKS